MKDNNNEYLLQLQHTEDAYIRQIAYLEKELDELDNQFKKKRSLLSHIEYVQQTKSHLFSFIERNLQLTIPKSKR